MFEDNIRHVLVCFAMFLQTPFTPIYPALLVLWTVRFRLRLFCARLRAGMLAQEMVTHEGPVEQLLKGDVNPFGQF